MTKINEAGWNFDNSYARLPHIFFRSQNPTPVDAPKLVIFNHDLAKLLGLNDSALESEGGVDVLAGNEIPDGAFPIAQGYAGHQFGHFTMLGDGRAVLLGEQITPQGERVDIQLKGSGITPFSRGGDGRAALGPMLREYIISEAMHGLGIPTTRSLAVVTTGESVIRQSILPGAILMRVAASHLRVGTFQYVAKWGTQEELRVLADYAIERHFPEGKEAANPYLFLLQEVIQRQASLIAKWQLVGFIHGVMNTDNMTISGETIDYGPCAFMDTFDIATVFSSIDTEGRYAYGNQPRIAMWNLARFAETLLTLLHDKQEEALVLAEEALQEFPNLYFTTWLAGMRAKLGLFNEEREDESLVEELLHLMQKYKADYTNTFRALTFNTIEETTLYGIQEFNDWFAKWQERLERQQQAKSDSYQLMKEHNPAVIPRNYRVELALEAGVERGDTSEVDKLIRIISKPFAHLEDQMEYATLPPQTNQPYRTFCGT